MKKNILTLFITSLLLVLTACESGSETTAEDGNSETKKIKVANFYGADHRVNVAFEEKFKTIVEEESNGSLEVEIYSNNQLGGEEAIYQGTQSGSIEIGILSVIMESEVPRIGLFTLPFLFDDFDHASRVLDSEVGEEIKGELEENTGLKHLGYGVNGYRVFSSNKPLESMEDFQSYRVRMPNVPQMIAIGQSLGATVEPLPMSELFSALEQGVVDGQENPYSTISASGFYEVQSHILHSNHEFLPNNIVANKEFWDELSSEEQDIVQGAMDETLEHSWELAETEVEEEIKFLEEEGLEIIYPDDEFHSEMVEATEPVFNDFYESNSWGEETVEKIRELAN
ncbi:TRAP transporter substrate-binding protein [Salinicoccus sp. HZC-1]|uniref:TRAP transporter substrate-binding protein n=1 Tax=Salinicoccus sp. HZC-1 TaxID=3385497 RepID=UPI00398B2169